MGSDELQQKDNDCIISESNAKEIYDRFITTQSDEKDATGTIISIEGTYGSGKSTIKEKFKKKLDINKTILVDYVALQHEEPSQVTSQLYMKIGDKLGCENKHLLSACAVLKKENIEASYISGSFGVTALIVWLIGAFITFILGLLKCDTSIKYMFLLFFIFVCFNWRNDLVRILSGFLPRYTHIKILEEDLQKSEFDEKALILLIDEIDRLDSRSVKLLLDEVLILHEILVKRDIKHKFFLFYNPDILKSLLSKCEIPDVSFYLQKYTYSRFMVYKPDFLHALHYKIFNCKVGNIFPLDVQLNEYQHIFSNPTDGKVKMPSTRILNCINNQLRSFRDLNRFIEYLVTKRSSICRSIIENHQRRYLDTLMMEIFFKFRYNIKLSDIINKVIVDAAVIKAYDEFQVEMNYMYGGDLDEIKSFENKQYLHSKTNMASIVTNIEKLYYRDTRTYLSIDEENNLENIFSEKKDGKAMEVNNDYIKNYIINNLVEFSFSLQAGCPNLNNLKDKNLLIKVDNCEDFLKLITTLETDLLIVMKDILEKFTYSLKYSSDLYNAVINVICYCFCKLIPTDENEAKPVYDKLKMILQKDKEYCTPILYLALNTISSYETINGDVNKHNPSGLLKVVEENISIKKEHAIFLFAFYNVFQVQSSKVTEAFKGCNPLTTHGFLFVLGITVNKFIQGYSLDSCVIEQFKDIINNDLEGQFQKFREQQEDYEGNDFYRAAYNIWKAYCGEPYDHFKSSTDNK